MQSPHPAELSIEPPAQPTPSGPRFSPGLALGFLVMAGLVAAGFYFTGSPLIRQNEATSTELTTPELAFHFLETLPHPPRSLYFTSAAIPFLEKSTGFGTGAELARRGAEYDSLAHNPKEWRSVERANRFDALLLMGDPANFRPLLNHLRQSQDWKLTYLDATSIIFRRAPAPVWTPDALEELKHTFAKRATIEQVTLRVQLAHRLIAIDDFDTARTLLEEAVQLDMNSSPAWTEFAIWHAAQGQWEQALETANRAIIGDGNYLPAQSAKANALLAHGRATEALSITRKLVEALPTDGSTLYLHAKVTHAAHAFKEEIEVLQKIIASARAHSLPTGTWHVFLGQAYASIGEANDALIQFKKALEDPGLTPQERSFAEKGVDRLENKEPLFGDEQPGT